MYKKNGRYIAPIKLEKRPKYYDIDIEPEIKGSDIGSINAHHGLGFFTNPGCYFWDVGLPCKFCGLRPTQKLLGNKFHLNPERVAKVTELALNETYNTVTYILIGGGTFEDFDKGFELIIDYVKAVKKIVGDKYPIITMTYPPNNLKLYDKLKKAGADRVDICIEVANKELFKEVCPAKHKFHGHEGFIDVARYAKKLFPKRTYLNIVMGLDKKKDLIDFIWERAREDIFVCLNAFYPGPYALYRNKKRPTIGYMYDILIQQQKVFKQYGNKPYAPHSSRHSFDYEAYHQMI